MRFFADAPTRQLWVLAQDPSITDASGRPLFTRVVVPHERLGPGPKGARVHVVDYDATQDKLIAPHSPPQEDIAESIIDGDRTPTKSAVRKLLGDPAFHAQNCYALVSNTILEFERALGRTIHWGFKSGGHQIKVAPHAFSDTNAFYSRDDELLAFGYFVKPDNEKNFVFTCLSHDIIVHETVHAILDGLRNEYIRPSSIDQAAFHEGFADIIALLSGFRSSELVRFALSGGKPEPLIAKRRLNPEALRKSFLAGLAEEFGANMGDVNLARLRGSALRRSAEMQPDPSLYSDEKLRMSAHDFGEVLVAPVINSFLDIWWRRIQPLDPLRGGVIHLERAIEEGTTAAQHLLRMCIRALDYLPPTNLSYGDFLSALITADLETAPDDTRYRYRDAIRNSFASYGIAPGSQAEDAAWRRPEDEAELLVYGFHGHAEMTWDREAVFRFLWENAEMLELQDDAFTKIVSVRPVVREGPDGFRVRETVVEYLQILHTLASGLTALGIDRPEGMRTSEFIRLRGGGTLIFNDYGKLKYHIATSVVSNRQTERLKSLWDMGAFETEASGESDFSRLHRARAIGHSSRRKWEQW